jgi:hypothetical protein
MPNGKSKEREARRAIEDRGYFVWDANVLFRENCPNIDLVVFGRSLATYIQVKSSSKPSGKDCVLVDGSPWTEEQLYGGAPIFNKHQGHFQASHIAIVETLATGKTEFYIAPPKVLEDIAVEIGRALHKKPKRNGEQRKMFRKEVPRSRLLPWRNAWKQLGEPEEILMRND